MPYGIPLVSPRAYLVKKAVRQSPVSVLPEPSVEVRCVVTRHVVDSFQIGAFHPAPPDYLQLPLTTTLRTRRILPRFQESCPNRC
jgi:hypothetical protein